MFSKIWWARTFERMSKTASYALMTLIGTDAAGWAALDWIFIGRTAGIMTLLSFLGAIATTKLGPDPQDPSAV